MNNAGNLTEEKFPIKTHPNYLPAYGFQNNSVTEECRLLGCGAV
jgi:hypothetical protein